MSHADFGLLVRIAVGFALAYAFGIERQLRGAPAGARTFALVGASSAAITAVASGTSPQAVAGGVTGIGFVDGGVVEKVQVVKASDVAAMADLERDLSATAIAGRAGQAHEQVTDQSRDRVIRIGRDGRSNEVVGDLGKEGDFGASVAQEFVG